MKTLVVYDSTYGNTRLVAEAIGQALSGQATVLPVADAKATDMGGVDRLIVGSPTHNGKATAGMAQFLDAIPTGHLVNVRVAAFDTRLSSKLAGIFGYAAARILSELTQRGGTGISAPVGFLVKGQRGPLKENEPERAAEWARTLERQGLASAERAQATGGVR